MHMAGFDRLDCCCSGCDRQNAHAFASRWVNRLRMDRRFLLDYTHFPRDQSQRPRRAHIDATEQRNARDVRVFQWQGYCPKPSDFSRSATKYRLLPLQAIDTGLDSCMHKMTQTESINEKFSVISEQVERFADAHNLELGKCLRGNTGWELSRPHPDGGAIYLLMMYDDALGLGIGSNWQVPCLETAMLYSHFRAMQSCPIEAAAVIQRLDREMVALSNVKYGHWTHLQPLHKG